MEWFQLFMFALVVSLFTIAGAAFLCASGVYVGVVQRIISTVKDWLKIKNT